MQYDIVTVCSDEHLHLLPLAVKNIHAHLKPERLFIIGSKSIFEKTAALLSNHTLFLDEDTMIPSMQLDQLQKLNLPGFPKRAGWYYQQLLKLSFAFHPLCRDRYVIWDSDTIPLRPIDFFLSDGSMIFTEGERLWPQYLEIYKRLFKTWPQTDFSFISQQMPIDAQIMKTMLQSIEENIPGVSNWAWKIMNSLSPTADKLNTSLLSEYELFGAYVHKFHSKKMTLRNLCWSRNGSQLISFHPQESDIQKLPKRLDYCAFESHTSIHNFFMRQMIRLGTKYIPQSMNIVQKKLRKLKTLAVSTPKRLSLVTPTHNRLNYLQTSIPSICQTKVLASLYIRWTIIDDASSSPVPEFLRKNRTHPFDEHLTVFQAKKSAGVCELNLRECWERDYAEGFDLFAVIDSDVIVHPLWLQKTVELFCSQRHYHKHLIVSGFDTENHPTLNTQSEFARKASLGGIHMLFDRATYEKIVRPSLNVSRLSWDWQVVHRMKKRGGVFLVTTPSYVDHIGEVSSARDSHKFSTFDRARNFIMA